MFIKVLSERFLGGVRDSVDHGIESKLSDRYEGVPQWLTSVPLPIVENGKSSSDSTTPLQWLDKGKTFNNGLKDALSKVSAISSSSLLVNVKQN